MLHGHGFRESGCWGGKGLIDEHSRNSKVKNCLKLKSYIVSPNKIIELV